MRLPSKDLQAINEAYNGSVLNEYNVVQQNTVPYIDNGMMVVKDLNVGDEVSIRDGFDDDGTIVYIDGDKQMLYIYNDKDKEGWTVTSDNNKKLKWKRPGEGHPYAKGE